MEKQQIINEWIKCSDYLPGRQYVLIRISDDKEFYNVYPTFRIDIGWYEGGQWYKRLDEKNDKEVNVSHWMHLPDSPLFIEESKILNELVNGIKND